MTDDVAVAEPADQANADVMNMLDHIAQANYEKANAIFNDQINYRLHNALEQEKVGIAQTITLDDLEATGEADETEEAEETPEAEAGEEAEIEAGAEDVFAEADGSLVVQTDFVNYLSVKEALAKTGFVGEGELTMVPSTKVELDVDGASRILRLVDVLEDLDDVQNVYTNADISEAVMEQLQ